MATMCFGILRGYFRLRAIGLVYGIRLFGLDTRVMKILKDIFDPIVK